MGGLPCKHNQGHEGKTHRKNACAEGFFGSGEDHLTLCALDKISKLSFISVMTEISDNHPASAREQFILHWGDMGGQWGVNRSVAQIHALLFLSSKPMHAEQISEELGIARSNVSNSLKELVSWRLIQRVPVAGDRREHFVAETDVWEMALRITKGRKEREIEPAIRAIDMCVQQAETEQDLDPVALQRMRDMQEFVTSADRWSEQMLKIPKSKLSMLLKMGDKVLSLLKVGSKTHD